jgi:hypothetical protein
MVSIFFSYYEIQPKEGIKNMCGRLGQGCAIECIFFSRWRERETHMKSNGTKFFLSILK